MSILDETQWDQWLDQNAPDCHILQRSAWGKLKSQFGWSVVRLTCKHAGAQILFRKLPLGFHIAYIPKGPCGASWSDLWPEIHAHCKKRNAIFLRVEPDLWDDAVDENLLTELKGFIPVQESIQPRRTVVLDLVGGEDDWLARMKQKTRYNIRLAQKKEICIIETDDTSLFYQLMLQTGARDQFDVHSNEYYESAYKLFHGQQRGVLFIAYYEDRPLAGVMVFRNGKRAWYLYGASNDEERSRMPTYLLQWEAMKWAAAKGCASYDLYGIPDETEESLEQQFMDRQDGLWSVYRFKRGFGGTVKRSVSTYDWVYLPPFYRLYQLAKKMRA